MTKNTELSLNAPARRYLVLAGIAGFLAVAFGAFGAHALKARLPLPLLQVFETGVRYQMYHALALLAVGLLLVILPERKSLKLAGTFFAIGTLLFSGSLYILALTGVRAWGAVTPLGGLSYLLAWSLLVWSVSRAQSKAQ